MKRIRTSFLIVVVFIIVLLVFQNQDFFMSKQILSLDFYFTKYETPLLTNIIISFFCFVIGLLIPTISYFSNKIKHEKILRLLRSRESSLLKLVSSLRQELEKIKTLNKDDFQNTEKFNIGKPN